MKKFLSLFFLLFAIQLQAQERLICRNASVRFFSKMPLENIEAVNNQGLSVIDPKSGNIEFSVLLKSFIFPNALMQEHFNENYVESDKFPKTTYKGVVVNNSSINYAKDGSYPAKVKGKLTMHGETKEIETEGTITIKNGKIGVAATFPALLSDYKVGIPQLVADKVAKTAKISVDCTLEPLTK